MFEGQKIDIDNMLEGSYQATLKKSDGSMLLGTLEISKNKPAHLILNQVQSEIKRNAFSLIEFETETNDTIKKANLLNSVYTRYTN